MDAEYYRKWSDRITIIGGIPSNLQPCTDLYTRWYGIDEGREAFAYPDFPR